MGLFMPLDQIMGGPAPYQGLRDPNLQTAMRTVIANRARAAHPAVARPTPAAPAPAPVAPAVLPPPEAMTPDPVALDPQMDASAAVNPSAAVQAMGQVSPGEVAPHGFFNKLATYLHSPGVSAALFRSGAETMQHGLGAGAAAGADYMDKRRQEDTAAEFARQSSLLEKLRADNAYNLGLGQIGVREAEMSEARRHNMAGESNETYRIDTDIYKHRNASGDAIVRESGETARNHETNETSRANNNLDNETQRVNHATPDGSTIVSTAGANYRANLARQPAPSTEKRQVVIHHTGVTPDQAAVIAGRGSAPSQVKPGGAAVVKSDADYNALPSGARFIAPDGSERVKP